MRYGVEVGPRKLQSSRKFSFMLRSSITTTSQQQSTTHECALLSAFDHELMQLARFTTQLGKPSRSFIF
jgi:hypothetical protein